MAVTRVKISVSDPWELGETLGWKPLSGSVIETSHERLLVKLDQPLNHGGRSYHFIAAMLRHEGTSYLLPLEGAVPSNFVGATDASLVRGGSMSSDSRGGGLVFIGAIAMESEAWR